MRIYAIALMLAIPVALIFGGTNVSAAETPKKQNKTVLIKSGDTLSKIAKKNDTTYKRLFNANKNIQNPDLIYPGEKVRIPAKNEKLKNRFVQTSSASQNYQKQTVAVSTDSTPNRTSYNSAPSNYSGGVWDKLAACESGGNWSINTGNGYYGGLQFNESTWRSNGGSGYPHQASKAEQIRVAKNLHASRGFSPWPACSTKLGLR